MGLSITVDVCAYVLRSVKHIKKQTYVLCKSCPQQFPLSPTLSPVRFNSQPAHLVHVTVGLIPLHNLINMDDTDWWTPDWGMDRETAIACMKEGAKASFPNRVSLIAHVDRERYAVFTRAMSNVLSTDISLETYAQIIDGLPIADVAWDRRTTGLFGDHPLDEHEQLCPGAVDKALELRDNWDPAVLRFNPKVSLLIIDILLQY